MISEVVADLAECIDAQPALHSSTLNFSAPQSQRASEQVLYKPQACGSRRVDTLAALE